MFERITSYPLWFYIRVKSNFYFSIGTICVATFISSICSYSWPYVLNKCVVKHEAIPILGFIFLMFISMITIFSIIVFIHWAFTSMFKEKTLVLIVCCYLSFIVNFGSLYFCDYVLSDANYAIETIIASSTPFQKAEEQFSLNGIKTRIWNGSYNPFLGKYYDIDLNSNNLGMVFYDCIHFSVVTITTLGYGDILPASISTKIISDIEVVLGQLIMAIAIAKVFYSMGKSEQ